MEGQVLPGRWLGLILLGVMVTALGFAVLGDSGLMRLHELRQQRDEILAENRRLKEQNRDLTRQRELLLHDDRYVERIAREELGMIRPKEMIFRFSPAAPSSAPQRAKP